MTYEQKRRPELDKPGWVAFEINGHLYQIPDGPPITFDRPEKIKMNGVADPFITYRVQQRYRPMTNLVQQETTPIYDALREEFEVEKLKNTPWAEELKRQREIEYDRRYWHGRDNY